MNTGDNQAVGKAIVLVGLMGTGKSSVGAKVARSIDAQFIDTDDLIAQQSGRSVREILRKMVRLHSEMPKLQHSTEPSRQFVWAMTL